MHVFYGEMSMRLLCRYAGGLACLVAALALVACGAGPGATKSPDPVGFKDIPKLEQGSTSEISLVNTFSGSDLTYTAKSNKPTVATVTVDNEKDTLTVRAVGPGTAKITVTAKNDHGSLDQDFTVTVPKPAVQQGEPGPPGPVEIPDIPSLEEDATRKIGLGDKFGGENFTYGASSSNPRVATVTVDNTADTLTVTAVGPGTATITVTATAQGSTPQTKTFTVTVPEAASAETAPTVKTGATSTVSVAVGATSTVTLSTVFDGATSYTATSSASTIATASESGGTLTIRGVSIGSATVTVTATNTAGSSPAHAIAVTVTAPVTTTPPTTSTSSCKSPLTIKLHETAKCTLSSKEQILKEDSDGVTVVRSPAKDTEWSIRAEKKGLHKVSIISTAASNSGEELGEITVKVPNSHPILENAAHGGIIINLTVDTPESNTGTDINTPSGYFSDPDDRPSDTPTVVDVKYYRIASKPDWFLINTDDAGFVEDGNGTATGYQLNYEVLKEVKEGVERPEYEFTVSLYGSDGEDDSLLPLVLKFNAPSGGLSPNEETYTLTQRGDKSNFYNDEKLDSPLANRLDVGPRRGVMHTVKFTLPDNDGFGFANSLHKKWKDDGKLPAAGDGSSVTTTATDAHYLGEDGNYVPPLPKEQGTEAVAVANRAEGKNYFILRSTGAVVAEWVTGPALGSEPLVEFKLKDTGSSGTIRIEYYVWTLSRDQRVLADGTLDDTNDPRDKIPTTRRSDSRTLTINVVTCSSPPDPIAACP